MTTYGLTPAGFVIKPLSQIVSDFNTAEQTTIDPQLNVDPTGPMGQLNGIVGAAASECWQVIQAVNGIDVAHHLPQLGQRTAV